jgi:phospholipid transport system transporter-binding protein
VRRDGNRLVLEGAATAGTVAALLDPGAAALRDGVEVIDFGAVTEVDSAAVALALAWLRAAQGSGRRLGFDNLPPAMVNLARLYGVDELIPRAPR